MESCKETTEPVHAAETPNPPNDARTDDQPLALLTTVDDPVSSSDATANPQMQPSWQPTPARGYTWPPFEPGNTLSLRHGAFSPQAIAAKAEQVHNELVLQAPWLAEEKYAPALKRYLDATAREALAHNALMASPNRVSPRLVEAATAAARLAWQMGDALGLTPAGHQKLKLLVAGAAVAEVDVANLASEGQALRRRLEGRQ